MEVEPLDPKELEGRCELAKRFLAQSEPLSHKRSAFAKLRLRSEYLKGRKGFERIGGVTRRMR